MGPIQSSINQMLGTAAIGAGLYAQSPMGKRSAALRQLNLQEKTLNNQADAIMRRASEEATHEQPFTETENKSFLNIQQENAEIAKKRFELKPTPENFTAQERAAEKAERSMQAEKARKQAQEELMKLKIYDAQGNIIDRSK